MTAEQGPIGRDIPRREDRRFLTGTARFIDDLAIAGALHARFVRSPHAHARIVAIDATEALALPGVVTVATGHDLAQWTQPLRIAPPIEGLHPVTIETLPTAKVRFHGDPVACVVATDRSIAEDAAEHVRVDYEQLPPWPASTRRSPRARRAWTTRCRTTWCRTSSFSAGDPDRRFADAHRVVEARFVQHRQTHVPMETRGCCAVWDEGRQHLTMHVGTQVPHPLSHAARRPARPDRIAGHRHLPRHRRRLRPEDRAVSRGADRRRAGPRPAAARCAGARSAAKTCWPPPCPRADRATRAPRPIADGRITALSLEIIEDFGAYCFYPANYLPRMVALILTGPYRIADYACDVRVVLTNKCGAAPMRAPMAIASWVMDGTIEAVARAPEPRSDRGAPTQHAERGRAALDHADRQVLEDVTPRETLDAALAAFDVPASAPARRRTARAACYRGMGLCCVVEPTTYGSAFYKAAGIPGSGHEAGWVKVAPTGAVDASVGLMGSGQGYETALAQAAAEGLGVPIDSVRLHLGNTDIAPYGMGSRGARGGTAGGVRCCCWPAGRCSARCARSPPRCWG